MGWRQYTPSSNATTLESKKSVSQRLYAYASSTPLDGLIDLLWFLVVDTITPANESQLEAICQVHHAREVI